MLLVRSRSEVYKLVVISGMSSAEQRFGRVRSWCAVVAAVAGALALCSCAGGKGTVDDGPAASLTPPAKPQPLWPGYTPPVTRGQNAPYEDRYAPIVGVRVSTPVSRADAWKLVAADTNLSSYFRSAARACAGAAREECPRMRPVANRDLTGDGEAEAVVALDDPVDSRTLLEVYMINGPADVRPVLSTWLPLGTTASTVGSELLVTSSDPGTRTTTVSRYRWNGEILSLRDATRSDRTDLAEPGAS
ncbi:hypothetical protein [Streptomyces iakyrus]|uniref:hypothetical protein n=1 Tax=Streptomyces iakyrus TaxID=68219 RepID=UPI003402B3BC